ncbi:hypothetical protein GCM10007385_22420 [Tateyamaria omphalii]|uniref:calcium-binding protein n=1 Tax=Tateyamaria omphalii TaxID=299262 RepID=UPI0016724C2C|nr:hypothetical protein [Tateyamaria omphalii]GGX53754.1 hypothetical protein GCM10007385_22420 [Tateyamaria omphalii]
MGALALLGLLSGALLLAAFDNDDPSTEDAETESDAVDEDIMSVTDGDSISTAAGNDTVTALGDDVTVSTDAGDDSIRLEGEDGVASGGVGNDTLVATSTATLLGDDGDDIMLLVQDGFADGGQGNDSISAFAYEDASAETTLLGGEGDDTLQSTTNSLLTERGAVTLDGGVGDDRLFIGANATGLGGDGNDQLTVSIDGVADGGMGDDTLISRSYSDEIAAEDGISTLTGGEGFDTFEIYLSDFEEETIRDVIRITDFDPDEDVIVLDNSETGDGFTFGSYGFFDGIEIVPSDDGSYTEVRVTLDNGPFIDDTVSVIRLDGVPNLTEDQIIIQGTLR